MPEAVLTAPLDADGRALNRVPRRVQRRPGLPGGRAVVGALLMTVAAVGIFVAYTDATTTPGREFAVAAGDLDAGTTIAVSDVRFVTMDLADEVASGAFTSASQLVGRRLLVPLLDGDLVQASAVSDRSAAAKHVYQVSFSLPRAFAVSGLVRRGDLVDVYATYGDDVTDLVVRRAEVLQAPEQSSRGFSSGDDQVVVLQLARASDVVAIVHASQAGEITLVRSTFADPTDQGPAHFTPDTSAAAASPPTSRATNGRP